MAQYEENTMRQAQTRILHGNQRFEDEPTWFLRTYGNRSTDDLAEYYRSVRSEVPLETPQADAYEVFHSQMIANRALEEEFVPLPAPQQTAKASRSTNPAWLPIAALAILVALSSFGAAVMVLN